MQHLQLKFKEASSEEERLMSDRDILEQLNNEEVKRQTVLMVYLILICLTGIPGNGLVCYLYRSEYSMSSSRWFIFFLGAVDIVLCLVIIPCELATLFQQYTFTNQIWCKFSCFFNLIMLISLALTLLIVSIDRYRKVCKPLGWQINFYKARILCVVGFIISFVIALPVFGVYDIYEIPIENSTVTAKECSFRKSMEESMFAFIYVTFGMMVFVGLLVTICVLYCIIGREIKHHIRKENIKRHISLTASMARKADHIRPVTEADVCKTVRFESSSKNKKSVMFSADFQRSESLEKINKDLKSEVTVQTIEPSVSIDSIDSPIDKYTSADVTEDSNSNTFIYEDEFKKPKIPLTRLQKSKSKRIRRARARKATFSMFLISIAFVVSYLPFLSLLLVRTLQESFDESLSDTGRAVYKFFLRSGYLNCAINPFIYGISDSSFRQNCRSVLTSIWNRLRNTAMFRVNS